MSEQLNWKFSVQVVDGPTLAASGKKIVDAYSKSRVVVPAASNGNDGKLELTLDTTGASILIVRASQYVDTGNPAIRLKYAVSTGGEPGDQLDFVGPLVMIGESTVRLLGDPVSSLTFYNPITSEITIDTLVGKDATP